MRALKRLKTARDLRVSGVCGFFGSFFTLGSLRSGDQLSPEISEGGKITVGMLGLILPWY